MFSFVLSIGDKVLNKDKVEKHRLRGLMKLHLTLLMYARAKERSV